MDRLADPLQSEVNMLQDEEKDIRTGVFLCSCGGKISSVLPIGDLSQAVSKLPGVVFVHSEAYPCSKDGLERMQDMIREEDLNRVLVAGCTPRLVGKLFQESIVQAGLREEYFELADIREQCAYVHRDDPPAARQKALDQISMGAARLAEVHPPRIRIGQIVKKALIVGCSLEGLAAALSLAENGIRVSLVVRDDRLGARINVLQEGSREILAEQIKKVQAEPLIKVLTGTRVSKVNGSPGDYQVHVRSGRQALMENCGVLVIASGAFPCGLNGKHKLDRSRIFTQAEFAEEIQRLNYSGGALPDQHILLLLECKQSGTNQHSSLEKQSALKLALQAKELNPQVQVSVLMSANLFDKEKESRQIFQQAEKAGVRFYRFAEGAAPDLSQEKVKVIDLAGEARHELSFDRLVVSTPLLPAQEIVSLAALLNLPQDALGFIHKPRKRLRPEKAVQDGIFIIGGAENPADTRESLLQAYLVTSRVLHFLKPEEILLYSPVAEIEAELCTGCGTCVLNCPAAAIDLVSREGLLSLAEVNTLRCVGCGACVVVCPSKAVSLDGMADEEILAQIDAALAFVPGRESAAGPKLLALTCEWGAYAAADLAGTQHYAYPADVRFIRLNCSARFDPYHVLWAFLQGADGVLLGACPPGECHYGESNLKAELRMSSLKKQLEEFGFDPDRLRFEFLAGDDPRKFAETITKFSQKINSLFVQ